MAKKFGIALFYLLIAYFIYIHSAYILDWIQTARNEWKLIPFTMSIATIMALFPVIPYPIVGGMIGATFGTSLGAVITWAGSSLASIFMFLFIRYTYQDWGMKILYRYKSIGKTTLFFEKNAFLTILFARLIPIIPSILINTYSALSRVPAMVYIVASSLGKIPSMVLFALVGNQFMTNPKNVVITIIVYAVFLTLTYFLYTLWQKTNARKVPMYKR